MRHLIVENLWNLGAGIEGPVINWEWRMICVYCCDSTYDIGPVIHAALLIITENYQRPNPSSLRSDNFFEIKQQFCMF